jgi:hypothetical protein
MRGHVVKENMNILFLLHVDGSLRTELSHVGPGLHKNGRPKKPVYLFEHTLYARRYKVKGTSLIQRVNRSCRQGASVRNQIAITKSTYQSCCGLVMRYHVADCTDQCSLVRRAGAHSCTYPALNTVTKVTFPAVDPFPPAVRTLPAISLLERGTHGRARLVRKA